MQKIIGILSVFQYRKRYEITCDSKLHVSMYGKLKFQYRKRYEITCDERDNTENFSGYSFQYRKRYEVTCDATETDVAMMELMGFQYRKRYEITCDWQLRLSMGKLFLVSIPQAV